MDFNSLGGAKVKIHTKWELPPATWCQGWSKLIDTYRRLSKQPIPTYDAGKAWRAWVRKLSITDTSYNPIIGLQWRD